MTETTAGTAADQSGASDQSRKLRRIRRGVVTSDARDKTITVVNQWSRRHPKYGKTLRRQTTLHVHDEQNEAKKGDVVEVMACRPVSKQKSWRLLRVISRGVGE